MALFGVVVEEEHWNEDFIRRGDVIGLYRKIFTRDQWLDIGRNMHFVEASAKTDEDKLWRLRPLITHLQTKFKQQWDPFQHMALDEEGIKNRSRISFLQYNPQKPAKWCIKVFSLVDASTYLYAFHIYTGGHNRPPPLSSRKSETSKKAIAALSAGEMSEEEAVIFQHTMKLIDQLPENRPFRLYFDNYYTSLELLQTLKTMKLRATGTINKKTPGFPNVVKEAKLQEKGEMVWRTLGGEYSCLKWQDTKGVLMASNFFDPSDLSESKYYVELKLLFFFYVMM